MAQSKIDGTVVAIYMNKDTKAQFSLNAVSNLLNRAIQVAVGLVIVPYAIHNLGTQEYGIFTLAHSVLGVLALADMGISVSLVRFAADGFSRRDYQRLTQVSSAGFILLGATGILGALLICCIIPLFHRFYRIPDNLVTVTTLLLVSMAFTFLFRFTANAPRGLLCGANRFDLANWFDIAGNILRPFWSGSANHRRLAEATL